MRPCFLSHHGDSDRHDQQMAQESRSRICQRTVGENPLPSHGPVDSVNRLVRTRMLGGVGRGREKLPLTRLYFALVRLLPIIPHPRGFY